MLQIQTIRFSSSLMWEWKNWKLVSNSPTKHFLFIPARLFSWSNITIILCSRRKNLTLGNFCSGVEGAGMRCPNAYVVLVIQNLDRHKMSPPRQGLMVWLFISSQCPCLTMYNCCGSLHVVNLLSLSGSTRVALGEFAPVSLQTDRYRCIKV